MLVSPRMVCSEGTVALKPSNLNMTYPCYFGWAALSHVDGLLLPEGRYLVPEEQKALHSSRLHPELYDADWDSEGRVTAADFVVDCNLGWTGCDQINSLSIEDANKFYDDDTTLIFI
ncbi:hypothetical protein WISP_121681 [Willisornis vidua]|uniref:Uncharacterized protein n=1 Tax=Willisornis vidua TaxID=1566151 RepID=A0ABQ9CYD7_9PASS|nr:hypothetical protein WISP_121681 [Willisornis vidua]